LNRRGAVVGGREAPFTLLTVPYVGAFCTQERGRTATHVAVRRRPAMHGAVSRHTSTQDTADVKIICYLPLFITSPAQRNATTDGNATYNDAVYVIAAVEIDYNVAVLV